jgi:F0F1-type ATP synthase assembly protein I
MPQTSQDEGDRQAYRYASLGMQFAGGTLLFAGVGFLLDRWLHIVPALTILGLLVGGGLSFYSIYRKVLGDQAAEKAEREKQGK